MTLPPDFYAAKKIRFVGRRVLLADARQCLDRGGTHIRYYTGSGGIGKTALLEQILYESKDVMHPRPVCSALEVIDLYDTEVRTPAGLIKKIIAVFGPQFQEEYFADSQTTLKAMDATHTARDPKKEIELNKKLRGRFWADLAKLASDHVVVLALDTLEVLQPERGFSQEQNGRDAPLPSLTQSLFDAFAQDLKGNVLLLLAGRPAGIEDKLEAIRKEKKIDAEAVNVPSFTLEEVSEYLRGVVEDLEQANKMEQADRLKDAIDNHADAIHHVTGGRPILLAIVADLVAVGIRLPAEFTLSSAELRQHDQRRLWGDMEETLVRLIQQSPFPIADTLRNLAWLRKGATAELLARVMDLRTADGKFDTSTAEQYLQEVSGLALVKVRWGGNGDANGSQHEVLHIGEYNEHRLDVRSETRIFLHDEMYTLLNKYVLQPREWEEQDRTYTAIETYYRQQIDGLEKALGDKEDISIELKGKLRQAQLEEMAYQLWHSPTVGFANYFLLAEEALAQRDAEQDALLRAELDHTVAELKSAGSLAGLDMQDVEIDHDVRSGARDLYLQGHFNEALNRLSDVELMQRDKLGSSILGKAHLGLYQAISKVRRGHGRDREEARELLERVDHELAQFISDNSVQAYDVSGLSGTGTPCLRSVESGRRDGLIRRAQILRALVLRHHGYLDWRQGRYMEAVRHYQDSAAIQRCLEMGVLLAATLINLAHANALTGNFRLARAQADEAAWRARRRGAYYTVASAWSTRAMIENMDNNPQEALQYAGFALEILSQVSNSRLQGLVHLSQAKACRYAWRTLTGQENKEKHVNLWCEAEEDADQAVSAFETLDEPPLLVEALIERGSVYRDWARELPQENLQRAELVAKSQRDFEDAAKAADMAGLLSEQARAWTNLAWLYYYIDDSQYAWKTLVKVDEVVPKDYLLPLHGDTPQIASPDRMTEAQLPFWSVLGEVEMLKSALAAQNRKLEKAVEYATLALLYDELAAGGETIDITGAEENLQRELVRFGPETVVGVYHYARKFAERQGLKTPTRFQRILEKVYGREGMWTGTDARFSSRGGAKTNSLAEL